MLTIDDDTLSIARHLYHIDTSRLVTAVDIHHAMAETIRTTNIDTLSGTGNMSDMNPSHDESGTNLPHDEPETNLSHDESETNPPPVPPRTDRGRLIAAASIYHRNKDYDLYIKTVTDLIKSMDRTKLNTSPLIPTNPISSTKPGFWGKLMEEQTDQTITPVVTPDCLRTTSARYIASTSFISSNQEESRLWHLYDIKAGIWSRIPLPGI